MLFASSSLACFSEELVDPGPAPTAVYSAVAVGAEHTCAIDTEFRTLCWGENLAGQLGVGDFQPRLVPALVEDSQFDSLVTVVAGGGHSCGIAMDGWTYCWGTSVWGQLGVGLSESSGASRPIRTSGEHRFVTLAAGDAHTCGLTAAGAMWCWGMDFDGRLARGGTVPSVIATVPDSALTDLTLASITAGDRHTCGLTPAGEAFCAGYGGRGQLGNGATTPAFVLTPVSGGHTFTALDAGRAHTCGVTTGGAILCWGAGGSGQIGDGQQADRLVPTPVASSELFVSVAAGGDNTCGITSDDTLWCWGRTQIGSIGDDLVEDLLVPEHVPGPVTLFRSVRAGNREDGATTCGVGVDGVLYCWGWGRAGQIGNGDIADQPEPTRVAGQQ